MPWIKTHSEMSDLPKIYDASELLAPSADTTGRDVMFVGHYHYLCWWAIVYAPDGDLSKHSALAISRGARWQGDPQHFVDAMTKAGFLDVDGVAGDPTEGKTAPLVIHDWWENHAGFLLSERRRKSVARAAVRTANGRSADTVRLKERKGKEEKSKKKTSSASPPAPPSGEPARDLGEAEFEEGWKAHKAAGASLDSKRSKKGNCAWRQWGRLLSESEAHPAELLDRWKRHLAVQGEFTKAPLRLLNPDKNLLTDQHLEDLEAKARARGGGGSPSSSTNGPAPPPTEAEREKDAARAAEEYDSWLEKNQREGGGRRPKFELPDGDVGDAVRRLAAGKAEA